MRSIYRFFKQESSSSIPKGVAVTVLVVALLWSSPALAAGFFLPTRGVSPTARGGASIAPHDGDLHSLWYNPAGLAHQSELSLRLDTSVVGLHVVHQRAPRQMDDGSTRSYVAVRNEAPPNVIPGVIVGGPTPLSNLSWAFGAYTPYSGGGSYPIDGPQRYVLVDKTGSAMGFLHLAVAWEPTDRIALGAGIQNFMGSLRVVTVASGYAGIFGDPEDEDLDLWAETTVTDLLSLSGNVGGLFRLTDQLHLGASFQLPYALNDAAATIDTRMPTHPAYDRSEVTDNRVRLRVDFPWEARLGLRWAQQEFDVELAVVYEHWSMLDELVVEPHGAQVTNVPGIGDMEVNTIAIPYRFRNTFSAHLGGRYTLNPTVDLLAGYVYERSAVPDEAYSLFALDPDKHQLSAGAALSFGSLTLELMGAAIVMPTREITTSEVRQVNPSDPDDELTLVVANGTYRHFGYMGGLGLRYAF